MVENHGLLSSCLPTTIVPALIQGATGFEPLLVYKWYSIILLPLLPVIVFMLVRRFVGGVNAFWATMLFMAQMYFLEALAYARVNIALLFLGGSLLVIFRGGQTRTRYWVMCLALMAIGVVISHYGTAYAMLFVLGVTAIGLLGRKLIMRVKDKTLKPILLTSGLLAVCIGIWYMGVTEVPWQAGKGVAVNTVSPPGEVAVTVEGEEFGFFDLEARSPVVQAAFGKTLPSMNTAQRVEFVFSWLSILLLSYGLSLALFNRNMREKLGVGFVLLLGACYLTILMGVISPSLSRQYGIARIYYTALVPLSLCFAIGVIDLSKRIKLPASITMGFVVIPLFLCTTGTLHSLIGLSR